MDYLCTADRSLAPNWFYYRTKFSTTKEQVLFNSIQRTLIGPRLTLANAKIPPKTDSETTHTDSLYTMWMLVDRLSISRHRGLFTRTFRKIVCYLHLIQRLGIMLALLLIVLAFFAIVQQRSSLKIWLHHAQQSEHTFTTPTRSKPILDTSIIRTCSGGPYSEAAPAFLKWSGHCI